MIELHLTRGDNQEGVRLRFPTTPAEIGEAFALLDTVSRYAGDVRILDVKSPVANIGQYVRYADLNSREDMQKLNTLAERIGGMSKRQRDIFAGALDAESVNGLDDVLRVSESLEEYTIIPNVSSDIAVSPRTRTSSSPAMRRRSNTIPRRSTATRTGPWSACTPMRARPAPPPRNARSSCK